MAHLSRRSVLRGSASVAAVATLARPFIANAQAKTAAVWWTQGFIKEEDEAFKKLVESYEKASGNKIDYTIMPFGPLGQKVVSALTSGDVPDLVSHDGSPQRILPQNAWIDKLVDVSDVVETQKSHYHPTAVLASQYYNSVAKKRAHYFAPFKCSVAPFHVWSSLVEKAGYKLSDVPKTWDAYFDFFKPMQKKLRAAGIRGVYALGLQITTTGPADGNTLFHGFLLAHGGKDILTADGQAHLDDPRVKEAVLKTLTYLTTAYKEGYVPPGALSWSDADDNNAFHAKQFVMDFDGTISTEVAMFHEKEKYNDVVTMGLPLDSKGKPTPAVVSVAGGYIPKGAKNVAVAKEFLKYLIQPNVTNDYLKTGLGRWLPVMPEIVKQDPFWLDPQDQHRQVYTTEGLLGPTVPNFSVFNPGFAMVEAQQIWGVASADIIREGMTPQAAADKALTRIAEILARYPIAQS
ncbi:MAG: carbohydrate ABC transporter substrate-binding protein [Proteobacteria bacterium]|nr:carbohydrate ABC transporter substrate-binding protein [Pseudomonadota bacterium]